MSESRSDPPTCDPSAGLNDWEPAVAFVRALLENSEDDGFCWSKTREYVLSGHHVLSQTFIQYLGTLRDERGIEIIIARLEQSGPHELTLETPWCAPGQYLEQICLEALARIGGERARQVIARYRTDPAKSYLPAAREPLTIAERPRRCLAPLSPDFPHILRGVRSVNDIAARGGCEARYPPEQAERMLEAFRGLRWRGHVEFLSGDGQTTTFRLKHRIHEHVHDFADPFCDFGIFRSHPKVEYPVGRRRWANSHTFLEFQIPDGALYGCEYTWDLEANTITTCFHERTLAEVTVNPDGCSITVPRTPISTGVELRGNVFSSRCTSAVRGVWDNPAREGVNYYTRRANILVRKRLYYFRPLHEPIVNQLGIWFVHDSERPERFFDADGICRDPAAVIDALLIPLHEPRILAWTMKPYRASTAHDPFASRLPPEVRVDLSPVPAPSMLEAHLGARFDPHCCGTAAIQTGRDNGYRCGLDINSDGVIDERDQAILAQHAGRVYRMNVGDYGYFGINWISLGTRPRSRPLGLDPAFYVCAYDYGAGYDPQSGIVSLFASFPPGKKLYVDYFYLRCAGCAGQRQRQGLSPPGGGQCESLTGAAASGQIRHGCAAGASGCTNARPPRPNG